MGVGSMTTRLHPLQRGGGGSSSGLPLGFPSLTTSRLTPGIALLDDFIGGVSIGSSAASRWVATQVGSGTGTAGLASASNTTTAATAGVLHLSSGTTANDVILAELSLRSASQQVVFPVSNTSENGGFNAMFRMAFGATRTSCRHGIGLIASTVTAATDWITDPDTVLGADSNMSLIIHQSTTAYGAGGLAASGGDVVARLYDNAGTDQMVTLVANAGGIVPASNPYKFEFSRPPGSTTITCYTNGVAMGTLTTSTASNSWRPSFGVVALAASARVFALDAYFLEAGTTMPAR